MVAMKHHNKDITVIGAGWLGLSLIKRLHALGHTTIGTSRQQDCLDELNELGAKGLFFDLDAPDWDVTARSILSTSEVLILTVPASRKRPEIESWYPDRLGSLTKLAQEAGVNQVIFTSSTGVYPNVNGPVTVLTPVEPQTSSTKGIVAFENELMRLGFPKITILRLAGLVGGDRHPVKFLSGRTLPGGDDPINLVDRDQVIEAVLEVLADDKPPLLKNVVWSDHPAKKVFYSNEAKRLGVDPPVFMDGHAPGGFKIVQ